MPTSFQSQNQSFASPAVVPGERPFDELRGTDGHYRTHWQRFFENTPDLGSSEFDHRWRDAQNLIRENGVTYNVYGDPKGYKRTWQLDPLPIIITPEEAQRVERGLSQRARLFELLWADIYGDQRILREGLLPPELLFANSSFLRPCHGMRLPLNRSMHLYGGSLARSTDGEWYILGDRTQTPSGAGYALENRIVVSRIFPEAFRTCRVQRIARFFQTLLETLQAIAPPNIENPRIVLMTPGPHNETYFEHSYLARYLGISLVQGDDLTVRDNRVYLKVLGGLQQVDVILRRVDDDFCDPLELRPDSYLGVPGLLQAVRSGTVSMANAIGTCVLESPGLKSYLPGLAKALLGEELLIPSPKTYWCGDTVQREYVLSHIDGLVIKSAFANSGRQPVIAARLDVKKKSDLIADIKSRPHLFVGESQISLSMSPVFEENQLVSRPFIWRTYLAATADNGYTMMPGGLTRVAPSNDTTSVSMQSGGGSKDTWVLAEGQISSFTRIPPSDGPIVINRGGGELPSRVADNLFWLGRYAERAESTCRLLRGIMGRLNERTEGLEIPALLRTIGSVNGVGVTMTMDSAMESFFRAEQELMRLLFDVNEPSSVAAAVSHLHRISGILRDRISGDMWRVVNQIRFPNTTPDDWTISDALDVLDRTILYLAAFAGLASESMTRTDGWRFLDLGRRLERAMQLCHLLNGTLVIVTESEPPVLDALLDIAESRITYRRRYLSSLRFEAVLDLLIFDDTNPRSLISQLNTFAQNIELLPRWRSDSTSTLEKELSDRLLRLVDTAQISDLSRVLDGQRPALENFIANVNRLLPKLSDVLVQHYLTHVQASRHLAPDANTGDFSA